MEQVLCFIRQNSAANQVLNTFTYRSYELALSKAAGSVFFRLNLDAVLSGLK